MIRQVLDPFLPEDSAEFRRQFFLRLLRRANDPFLRLLSIVAAILFPLFGLLDHVQYPEIGWRLNLIRIGILPAILAVFAFTFWKKSYLYVLISSSVLYQAMAFAIDLMVYAAGGVESGYYAGVNLVLVAMFVFMPLRPTVVVYNALGIYAVYACTVWVAEGRGMDVPLFISNSYFILGTIFIGSIGKVVEFRLLVTESRASTNLENEKARSDALLLNVLPAPVARKLREQNRVEPKLHDSISIMFTDFVGFTQIAAQVPPEVLVRQLESRFQEFDHITERYRLEKLKTIGDSYMCAGGIPVRNRTHALDCVLAALEILDVNRRLGEQSAQTGEPHWSIRIGIHSGPVVSGILGTKKFAYDIWGDSVNTAARLESHAASDGINLSEVTQRLVHRFFECEARGNLNVKGKGEMPMYTLKALRPEFRDATTGQPNVEFFRAYRAYSVYGR